MLMQQTVTTPLGAVILLGNDHALVGLWFADQAYLGAQYELNQIPVGWTPVLHAAATWVTAYFAGQKPDPRSVPLTPNVTVYRERVLTILQTIPYGQTLTYQAVAQRLAEEFGGRPAPRAVGGAVGHNPISLLIPCHRVVGSDGQLTGYAGGLKRKVALLTLEGHTITQPDRPRLRVLS